MRLSPSFVWPCLAVVFCVVPNSVWADDPLIGKRVVVIKDKAPLAVSGKEAATASECSVFTVTKVDGDWLWIASERAYVRRGDVVPFDEAIGHYTRVLETNKTANNYWNRAQIWRLKGELDIALGDMNDAIRLNSTDSVWFQLRGVLWIEQNDYDKAIADFSEAIRLNPKNGSAYDNRGVVWTRKKDYDKAIADFDEALKHTAPNAKTGTFNDSEITGGDSTAMVNSRAMALSNRGWAWAGKGDYDKAIADYEEAIRLDPKFQKSRHNRRDAWGQQKAWDKIIADCDTSIRENTKDALLFASRGWAWWNKQEYDKALADYEEAIRLDPKEQFSRGGRRDVWKQLKAWDKIIADCNDAIHENSKDADHFNWRGVAWFEKGDYDKAIADYEEAIRLDPKFQEPRTNRRSAWWKKGHWVKLDAEYEATSKEGSPTAGILSGLAWLRATCPDEKYRNGPQAVEYATKACELTKYEEASHFGTLAAAYAEAGEFDKAVEWQKKGMGLAPADQKADYESRLKLYLDKQPYRQPVPE